MAVDIPDLDVSTRLVKEDGTASIYFEELWHLVVICCAQSAQLQAQIDDLQAQIDALGP